MCKFVTVFVKVGSWFHISSYNNQSLVNFVHFMQMTVTSWSIFFHPIFWLSFLLLQNPWSFHIFLHNTQFMKYWHMFLLLIKHKINFSVSDFLNSLNSSFLSRKMNNNFKKFRIALFLLNVFTSSFYPIEC